jgi:DUF4097 and DUF4098 domain-containing protein YvlB
VTSRALLASCLAAATIGGPACVVNVDHEGQIEREDKRFAVSKTPADLRLTTFDGAVEVRSWDRPEVLVQIEKRGPDKESIAKIEILSEQKGDIIQVEARHTKTSSPFVGIGFFLSPSAKLIASVPRNTNVTIRTSDGAVVVSRVTGRVEIKTGDGSVRVAETAGELLAETGDGSIQIDDVTGKVEARTGDGSIRLSGTPSSLRARSGDGSIWLRIRSGAAMADDWMVATGDGSISIELPDGFAAQVEADPGSDGRVRNDLKLEGLTGGTREKRLLTGALGAGGRRLSIRTGDGTIRLTSY